MPLFGQVWLWSLLAFVIGALITWVLTVLPIRRRMNALERRLATIRAETKLASAGAPERKAEAPPERPAPPAPPLKAAPSSIVPGFGDPDADEIRPDSLTRAYAMPGLLDTPPSEPPTEDPEERGALRLSGSDPRPPSEATEYIGALGAPLVSPRQPMDSTPQGWFEDEREPEPVLPAPRADQNLVDDADQDEDEDRGTIFTQRTMPIPADVISRLDEAAKPPAPSDASLVDDLDDEPEEAPAPPAPEPAFSGADTVIVHKNGSLPTEVQPAPEPEPEPERMPEPVASEPQEDEPIAAAPPKHRHMGRTPIIELNKPLELDRTQSVLPKRIPAKPQHRHPFGVQTVSPALSAPVAAAPTETDTGAERMRSLFEPVIPAETTGGQGNAVLPPPHRLHTNESRPSTPGPFGPGSAMPLPGGASPSPEFTVKASVTALRYCTPESPQFGKTVAEVWFRSAADAERVGFRPVG